MEDLCDNRMHTLIFDDFVILSIKASGLATNAWALRVALAPFVCLVCCSSLTKRKSGWDLRIVWLVCVVFGLL